MRLIIFIESEHICYESWAGTGKELGADEAELSKVTTSWKKRTRQILSFTPFVHIRNKH